MIATQGIGESWDDPKGACATWDEFASGAGASGVVSCVVAALGALVATSLVLPLPVPGCPPSGLGGGGWFAQPAGATYTGRPITTPLPQMTIREAAYLGTMAW